MPKTVTIELTDFEETAMLSHVEDIDEWFENAKTGVVAKAAELLDREWTAKLDDDPAVTTKPATMEGRVEMIVARDDYDTVAVVKVKQEATFLADRLADQQKAADDIAAALVKAKAADPKDQDVIDELTDADAKAKISLANAKAIDDAAKAKLADLQK